MLLACCCCWLAFPSLTDAIAGEHLGEDLEAAANAGAQVHCVVFAVLVLSLGQIVFSSLLNSIERSFFLLYLTDVFLVSSLSLHFFLMLCRRCRLPLRPAGAHRQVRVALFIMVLL